MATADEAMAEARQARMLIDHHIDECSKREAFRREDAAEIGRKVDQVGQAMRDAVGKVHGRVDQLHYWAIGTAGVVVLTVIGALGYVIKDGLPWQQHLAGLVSTAAASDDGSD